MDCFFIPKINVRVRKNVIDDKVIMIHNNKKYTFGVVESRIICQINGNVTINDIADKLGISSEIIIQFVEYLSNIGIIEGKNAKTKNKYLDIGISLGKLIDIITDKCSRRILMQIRRLMLCLFLFSGIMTLINLEKVIDKVSSIVISIDIYIIIELLICIAIHELGHWLVATQKGVLVNRIGIRLINFGGFIELIGIHKLKSRDKVEIYLAGMMANFYSMIVCYNFMIIGNMTVSKRCFEIVYISLLLIIFNLMPYKNSDGYVILGEILKNTKRNKVNIIIYIITFIILFIVSLLIIKYHM